MIIALIGPHAIGKTTALKRWSTRYPLLKMVACDNGIAFDGSGWEERQKGWLASSKDKVACATKCADDSQIWVCEGNSARNAPWLKVVPLSAIIHVYCTPDRFGRLMRNRCEAKGKEYRADYWSPQMLSYEAAQRFRNMYHKHTSQTLLYEFEIQDQERDWKAVDTQFARLLKGTNNHEGY